MTSEGISARDENMKLGESLVGLYSSIGGKSIDCYIILEGRWGRIEVIFIILQGVLRVAAVAR